MRASGGQRSSVTPSSADVTGSAYTWRRRGKRQGAGREDPGVRAMRERARACLGRTGMRCGGAPASPGSSTVKTRDRKPDFLKAVSCGADTQRARGGGGGAAHAVR